MIDMLGKNNGESIYLADEKNKGLCLTLKRCENNQNVKISTEDGESLENDWTKRSVNSL